MFSMCYIIEFLPQECPADHGLHNGQDLYPNPNSNFKPNATLNTNEELSFDKNALQFFI